MIASSCHRHGSLTSERWINVTLLLCRNPTALLCLLCNWQRFLTSLRSAQFNPKNFPRISASVSIIQVCLTSHVKHSHSTLLIYLRCKFWLCFTLAICSGLRRITSTLLCQKWLFCVNFFTIRKLEKTNENFGWGALTVMHYLCHWIYFKLFTASVTIALLYRSCHKSGKNDFSPLWWITKCRS